MDAVFISDLHLEPNAPTISARFLQFVQWAAKNTRKLYILGDFFHAWPGDDGIEPWSLAILQQLKWLSEQGVTIYFMHGNRDFLLGSQCIKDAGMLWLPDPSVIHLGTEPILLAHGDKYCTHDKKHQWFRRLTRSRFFSWVFLKCSLTFRQKMVNGVRQLSQAKPYNPKTMHTVPKSMIKAMRRRGVNTLIHGHTHRPGFACLDDREMQFNVWTLSDWDDIPQVLCYHNPKGLYFTHFC